MELWEVWESAGMLPCFTSHRQEEAEAFKDLMNAGVDASLCCDLVLGRDLAMPYPPVEAEPEWTCGHCRRVLLYPGPCWMCRNAMEIRS